MSCISMCYIAEAPSGYSTKLRGFNFIMTHSLIEITSFMVDIFWSENIILKVILQLYFVEITRSTLQGLDMNQNYYINFKVTAKVENCIKQNSLYFVRCVGFRLRLQGSSVCRGEGRGRGGGGECSYWRSMMKCRRAQASNHFLLF